MPLVSLISPTGGAAVSGDVTAKISVVMGDETDLTIDLQLDNRWSWSSWRQVRQVTAAECGHSCTVDIVLDTDSFDTPMPSGTYSFRGSYWGEHTQSASWTYGEHYVEYTSPVGDVPAATTRRIPSTVLDGYADTVVDQGIALDVAPAAARPEGEVLEVRLLTDRTYTADVEEFDRRDIGWGTLGDTGATTTFDTSSLAEGMYVIRYRPRSTAGEYGPGREVPIVVRHTPAVTLWTGQSSPQLAASAEAPSATVRVRGPLAAEPGPLDVTIDGVSSTVAVPWSPHSFQSVYAREDRTVTIGSVPAVGTHRISARLVSADHRRLPLGPVSESTFDIVTYSVTATPGVAIYGRASAVTFSSTAPQGMSLSSCDYSFEGADGVLYHGSWCSPGGQSATTRVYWTPHRAGMASYTVSARADPLVVSKTGTMYVYPARTVADLSAEAARYGSTQHVRVYLVDVGAASPKSPSGLPVTLWFRKAGTTTWAKVTTKATSSTGRIDFAYTSRSNGSVRITYPSTVPGLVESSKPIAVTSIAALSTSLPTIAYRYKTVTLKVSAYPYSSAAKVTLQRRLHGTSTWSTVKTITAPSSGSATFTLSFSKRALYDVRVLRTATTLNTSASVVRHIRIY